MSLSEQRATPPLPPSQVRPVPWAGPLARVRAGRRIRRLVPTGPALAATDLLYRVAVRRSPARRAEALATVDAIAGGLVTEAELPRLARAHVTAQARGWELTWRPWELARIPVRGAEHLAVARASGRGLVVSHTHLGPLAGWVALGPLLRPLYHPAGDWVSDPTPPGYNGYQLEQRRRLLSEAGIELVAAGGSGLRLYTVLRAGGAALLTLDAPGERRTRLLGRPVDLDDGTAQLAARAGALVLPAALLPRGRRWALHLAEPLDPRDFADPDQLHLALVAVHERWLRAVPEHLEDPRRLWSRATRDGWYRS